MSRVLGVVRESVFTWCFGATRLTDAYGFAFLVPNLLRDLFAEGALSSAFVPTFSEALVKEGREKAYRLGNLVLSGLVVVTGTLTLLGILGADLIAWAITHWSKTQGTIATDIALFTRVMMPILLLVSVSAMFMGMLNAQKHFTIPAFAPALFNVVCIGVGGVIWRLHLPPERPAMLVFSVATTAAAAVQAFCQLPALWRLGFRPHLVWAGITSHPGVRRIVRLMAPAAIGLSAMNVNTMINVTLAWSFGAGAASLLRNAFRLFYLPIGLFGVALATVTTARVSEEAARGDAKALLARTLEGVRAVWMLALPSAVGLIVLAEPVIALLFRGGRFSQADSHAMVPIVRAYMLGVLPYSLVKVYAPTFYAVNRSRVPMMASLTAVGANIAFSLLVPRWLGQWGYGAAGLALGTTVAALVNLTLLRQAFGRVVGSPRDPERALVFRALVVANLLLGVVAWGAWRLSVSALAHLGPASSPLAGRLTLGLFLFASIGAAFSVYALTLSRLGYPGAEELLALPRKLVGKFRR